MPAQVMAAMDTINGASTGKIASKLDVNAFVEVCVGS